MRTNKNIKTKHGLIILTIFILIFGIIIYLVTNTNKGYAPETNTIINIKEGIKNFKSKTLRFNIAIPNRYTVTEGQTYVDLLLNGVAAFNIVRNGTNFESLSAYLKDSDDKKKVVMVTEEKTSTINEYESVSRIETNTGSGLKQKLYYIYADNWAYILSTSSEDLFDDLDQIAQSFKYTP